MAPIHGYADDLTTLSELDDNILLKELKERYTRDIIYTYIGDILLAVNPYKSLPCYGDQIGHNYEEIKEINELSPHVYAIATRCYQNIVRSHANQCLLVSGESGAGKTETSKMLVAQLVRISKTSGIRDLHEQVIQVNPLLEAFGNARTIMNANSSRFGKLIEIMLSDSGEISGARITEHMLEKTRVVRKNQGERTFHIFYYMFAGLSEQQKRRYFLDQPPEHYRTLDPGFGNPVYSHQMEYDDDASTMEELKNIMEVVGFENQEVDMILGLISGLLHLTNIEFAVDPEMGHVIIMNEDAVDCASTLLSLQPEDLATVLLSNRAFVRGERIVTMKTVTQAVDGRDSLAKTLYARLFSWMIKQINTILDPDQDEAFGGDNSLSVVSILDMAGFENFPVNSLEQLCINTANEQLQNFFNEHVFNMELREYKAEGIMSPKVKFSNNRDVLDLLLRRPMGIFALLEDDCKLQTSTDMSFVDRLNQTFSKHVCFKKSRAMEPVFTVCHYAGQVIYRAEGFLDKNRDTMSPNLFSLMENSSSRLIAQLFGAVNQLTRLERLSSAGRSKNNFESPEWSLPSRPDYAPGDTMSRQIARKIKQRLQEETRQPRGAPPVQSSSGHFRGSLGELVEKLEASQPSFIRCIKPNGNQEPMNFDPRLVLRQLENTGVLETTKIRKLGYSSRLPFEEFVRKYKFLAFPLIHQVHPDYNACLRILQATDIRDCEIGRTKVFLRYWQVDRLNLIYDDVISRVILTQNLIRMYVCRKQFLRKLDQHFQCQEMIGDLCGQVSHDGDRAYHMMISSRDHDQRNRQIELDRQRKASDERKQQRRPVQQNNKPKGLHRYDYNDDTRNQSAYNPYAGRQPGLGYYQSSSNLGQNPPGNLYQTILGQVTQKLSEVDFDVWCKIYYLEYDRTVSKFYILEREVTVDGSYEEFDGERIGLGVFRNADRDNRTEQIRQNIGKGLKLRKDEDGSIFATRLGSFDAVVKDHQNPRNHCFSADVIQHNGHLPLNYAVKVFDMEEFKSQMGLQLKSSQYNEHALQHQCIVGISFVEDNDRVHDTPCWVLIINMIALRNINNSNVKNLVQQRIAELSIRDQEAEEEELRKKEAGRRQYRRRWSKMNVRQGAQGKDAPLRKTRLELRSQGQDIKQHMVYSWDQQNYDNKQLNLADLQEQEYDEPESMLGSPRSPTSVSVLSNRQPSYAPSYGGYREQVPRKQWAKLSMFMKEEARDLEERDFKAKQEHFS